MERIRFIILSLGILLSVPVFAQNDTDPEAAFNYKLDYSVPESPAFSVLDANPAMVARGTSAQELIINLANNLINQENLNSGIAVDFNPFFVFGGKFENINEYRGNYLKRVLGNTQLSFATTTHNDFPNDMLVSAGVRFTLYDSKDLLFSKDLGKNIDEILLPKKDTDPYEIIDGLNDFDKTVDYVYENSSVKEYYKIYNVDTVLVRVDSLFLPKRILKRKETVLKNMGKEEVVVKNPDRLLHRIRKIYKLTDSNDWELKKVDSLYTKSNSSKSKADQLKDAYEKTKELLKDTRGYSLSLGFATAGRFIDSDLSLHNLKGFRNQVWLSGQLSLKKIDLMVLGMYRNSKIVQQNDVNEFMLGTGLRYSSSWFNIGGEAIYSTENKKIDLGTNFEFLLGKRIVFYISIGNRSNLNVEGRKVRIMPGIKWNLSE